MILNYNYIIIVIILIISIIIILKTKSNNFSNNIKKNESFTTTKDFYGLTLSGCTIATLYRNNTTYQNQFNKTNWHSVNLNVELPKGNTVKNPYIFEKTNNSIILNTDTGYISGLMINKLYKLDVLVTLSNINMSTPSEWSMTVVKLKLPSTTSTNITNYEDFPTPLITNSYLLKDFYEMTFPISAFITDCTSFSIFIKNNYLDRSLKSIVGSNVVNTLITISLLEM